MAWISDNYGFNKESDHLYQKVSIHQLSPELSQVMIFGIIIAKQDVRRIVSKKQPGSERYVLNFTLRDSPTDTLNAVCWGEETNIKNLSSNFTIGDIVKIKNPQIIERNTEFQENKFRPPVSSHYLLNISALYSEISTFSGENCKDYKKLLHCPMRNSDIISLADVVYNSQNADGLTLNLLVAIKDIKSLQYVKTKNGREVKRLLIKVFDQSHPLFPVIIWEEETANFLIKYCCRRSVILITDIKVGYNTYMKEMAATAGSATVFTPNPDIPEGRVLYQYAMNIEVPNENAEVKYADPSQLYTLKQIYKAMNASEMETEEIEGSVHALLSSFDIDGQKNIFSLRCPGCYQILEKMEDKCINGSCEIGSGMKFSSPEEMYDITVSLTDDTATIDRCLLGGQTAESLLGLNVKDFIRLSDEEKTELKWKYLFEWFIIHFKMSQSATGNGKFFMRILQLDKWNPV